MRFGINTMQQHMLFPAGLSRTETLAHLASLDHASLAAELTANGFDPVEISADLMLFLPHTWAKPAIDRLRDLAERTGVGYTVHLPLWSVEPSTPLNPVREGSTRALIDAVTATLPLQPECYVLHATGALAAEFYRLALPSVARSYVLDQFQAQARKSLSTIVRETGVPSRRLAIETVEFPFDLTLELAEEFDLSVCLDTGHVIVGFAGPVGLFEALERSMPRLAEIHLHDGPWQGPEHHIGYGMDHQPLGTGDLDVLRLLDTLEAASFAGPLVFEMTLEQALDSLAYIRALRRGAAS